MIKVGDKASITSVFSEQRVQAFADLSYDINPLHMDDDYESATSFGQRIVHGAHLISLVSAVVGTKLPGPGTLFLRQSIEYLGPVFLNENVTACVEVVAVTRKGLVSLKTSCMNKSGETVLEGTAEVKIPRAALELSHSQGYYQ